MKRFILSIVATLAALSLAQAQNYMVINSETVFKSLSDYVAALSQVDTLSEQYQKDVDAKFKAVENMYNEYQQQKQMLSANARQAREQAILAAEKEATEYQKTLFGNDGTIMKKRVELIQPIQKRVFAAIETYAKQNGFDLVIDIAANSNVLYYSPKLDRTQDLIKILK